MRLGIQSVTLQDILIGLTPNKPAILANQIIILAKKHILSSKYRQTNPRLDIFQYRLRELYEMEKTIFQKLDHEKQIYFTEKWQHILQALAL
jgi:hypothetical protein